MKIRIEEMQQNGTLQPDLIDIYYMKPKAPCFIRDEEQNYIYLILPVNFVDA